MFTSEFAPSLNPEFSRPVFSKYSCIPGHEYQNPGLAGVRKSVGVGSRAHTVNTKLGSTKNMIIVSLLVYFTGGESY